MIFGPLFLWLSRIYCINKLVTKTVWSGLFEREGPLSHTFTPYTYPHSHPRINLNPNLHPILALLTRSKSHYYKISMIRHSIFPLCRISFLKYYLNIHHLYIIHTPFDISFPGIKFNESISFSSVHRGNERIPFAASWVSGSRLYITPKTCSIGCISRANPGNTYAKASTWYPDISDSSSSVARISARAKRLLIIGAKFLAQIQSTWHRLRLEHSPTLSSTPTQLLNRTRPCLRHYICAQLCFQITVKPNLEPDIT